MKEIVILNDKGNIIQTLSKKEHKLTDEQIKNLEDDGFFSDLDAERYRLSVELYNED